MSDTTTRYLDSMGGHNSDLPPHERRESLRVSNEGFGELITKIKNTLTGRDKHGVKGTDKKPGEKLAEHEKSWTKEAHAAVKELRVMLDKYYLNDNWLNAQKFYEGSILADDFSAHLMLDNKIGPDPLKNPGIAAERIIAFNAAWKPKVEKLATAVAAINARVEAATKGAAEDDTAMVRLVEAAIAEMNALPDPLKSVPRFNGTSTGNRVPVCTEVMRHGVKINWLEVEVKPKPVAVSTLPALTKERVKQAAQLIKDIYTPGGKFDPEVYVSGWLDHSNGSAFNAWIYDADNNVYMEYYDRFEHQGAYQTYTAAIDELFDTHAVVRALEKWINRSFH